MKQLFSLPILLLFILYSCSNNEQKKVTVSVKKDTVVQIKQIPQTDTLVSLPPEIMLDTFSKTPADTIGGCTATFSTDSLYYEKRGYVFIADYTGFSAIKVDNKLIFLHAIYKGQKETIDNESTYEGTFEGEGFVVRIKTMIAKVEGDEYSTYTGTMEVSKGKRKVIYKIYGAVGC
ncbi:MAG TPA: hypothetical protein VK718_11885 [Ferruginibacter sp.]|nr:hypothetical protein [Ferruginibacter sp.]